MSYYLATKESIVDWIKGLASEKQVYFPLKHGENRATGSPRSNPIPIYNLSATLRRWCRRSSFSFPAREELLQFRKNADGKSEVKRFAGHLLSRIGRREALRPQGDLPDGSLL